MRRNLLTIVPSLADLKHLESQATEKGEGIDTPGHAHHFANKGIDPAELNSSLKKHIAAGARQGERRLNDFGAHADERLNPHFVEFVKKCADPAEGQGEEEEKQGGTSSVRPPFLSL